jgi:hypothetical protein
MDGRHIAKHLRRARHAVPLRNRCLAMIEDEEPHRHKTRMGHPPETKETSTAPPFAARRMGHAKWRYKHRLECKRDGWAAHCQASAPGTACRAPTKPLLGDDRRRRTPPSQTEDGAPAETKETSTAPPFAARRMGHAKWRYKHRLECKRDGWRHIAKHLRRARHAVPLRNRCLAMTGDEEPHPHKTRMGHPDETRSMARGRNSSNCARLRALPRRQARITGLAGFCRLWPRPSAVPALR